jgi:hypothetical protein
MLAAEVLAKVAADDETILGGTVILRDGEVQFLDAAMVRRGGRA